MHMCPGKGAGGSRASSRFVHAVLGRLKMRISFGAPAAIARPLAALSAFGSPARRGASTGEVAGGS